MHIISIPLLHMKTIHYIILGLTTGVITAGIFNPWDRALYLSVKRDRPFLHYDNWRRPYSGFLQTSKLDLMTSIFSLNLQRHITTM